MPQPALMITHSSFYYHNLQNIQKQENFRTIGHRKELIETISYRTKNCQTHGSTKKKEIVFSL
jgi:hypothetical protein